MSLRFVLSSFSAQNQRTEQNDRLVCEAFEGNVLAAVADGCGTHMSGDVAAEAARLNLLRLTDKADLGAHITRHFGSLALCEAFDGALATMAGKGGASTCTALLLLASGKGYVAHIGDSAAFRVRQGKLELLTQPHRVGATRNVLSRAIHGYGEFAKASTKYTIADTQAEPGDVYLLATDGCYEALPSPYMETFLANMQTDSVWDALRAQRLVGASIRAGARDNSTAIIIRVEAA